MERLEKIGKKLQGIERKLSKLVKGEKKREPVIKNVVATIKKASKTCHSCVYSSDYLKSYDIITLSCHVAIIGFTLTVMHESKETNKDLIKALNRAQRLVFEAISVITEELERAKAEMEGRKELVEGE